MFSIVHCVYTNSIQMDCIHLAIFVIRSCNSLAVVVGRPVKCELFELNQTTSFLG